MATATAARYHSSVADYPEHLNPFREDEQSGKKKFWTLGRRMNRSASVSFPAIKELKNSWALRSFMRKGKNKEQFPPPKIVRTEEKKNIEESSPIVYRRALQSSLGNSSGASGDRYVYGGSVTPLPRSRHDDTFHSLNPHNHSFLSISPRLTRSELSESRASQASADTTNPFEESPPPVRPARSYRRKKRAAPPPPPKPEPPRLDVSATASTPLETVSTTNTTLQSDDGQYPENDKSDLFVEQIPLDVELKIVEEFEDTENNVPITKSYELNGKRTNISQDENSNKIFFPKIDITKYRRNSSINENDVKFKRANVEDYHVFSNKRSMSFNASDLHYIDDDTKNGNKDEFNDNNNQIQKVVCRIYNENTTDKDKIEIQNNQEKLNKIEKATMELEKEISKLNNAFLEENSNTSYEENSRGLSFSEIKTKFNNCNATSPNPIPKPKRSNCSLYSEKNNNAINS